MLREFHIIFRDNDVESLVCPVDLNKLQDLEVVLVDIIGQSERTNVNHVNVGVFYREDTRDLRVLLLLQFFSGKALQLR